MEKLKQRPNFYINLNLVRQKEEEEIKRKMQEIKDPNLNDFQKRVLVINNGKTRTFVIQNEIDIEKEKNKNDCKATKENLNNNISIDKDDESSIINDDKTNDTTININDISKTKMNINDDYFNKSQIFFMGNDDNSNNSTLSNSIEESKFNSLRTKFYENKKLYDVPLNIVDKDVNTPEKCKITDKLFAFIYPNNLITYYISESGCLLDHKNDEKKSNINNNYEIKYYKEFGLYYCKKTIEIQTEKGIITKKCSPNEFMCKECMKINKNKYYINNNYLININGRVSKINKGKYHCFGHFLCSDNQIYDCINKFSCKACSMLNAFSKYFENCSE